LLLAISVSGAAGAQDADVDAELAEFMRLLEQQTSLATNTRLNADFVPGIVSVLDAAQLRRRGFRNVWEALASLPGVIATMNETGMRSISVRGVGGVFEPSKVKLLLNGRALNASASATTGTLYDTPIEQVERIEFVRGPGSAIHGEFAYAGVLNVITRDTGKDYTLRIGQHDEVGFSSLLELANRDGFSASLNLAAVRTDGEEVDSGLDRSPMTIPSFSPGPINNKRDFVSAILDLDFDGVEAVLQLQQGNRGDYFGTNNLLPPDQRQTVISDSVVSLGVAQGYDLGERLSGRWAIDYLYNSTEQNELFLGPPEAFGGFGTEDDIIADSRLEERRLEARANLQYSIDAHEVFVELSLAETSIGVSEQFINLAAAGGPPSATMNEFPGPVDEDEERGSVSLVLQDEYHIDDDLTLTTGLRYDDYEDIDDNLSPRIALVWRYTDEHVFKAQLARAFRPPSLVETGGSIWESIDPEISDTLEFGHIFHGTDRVLRNTLYSTRLDDLIEFQDMAPFGYQNTGSQRLTGYEFELEQSISEDWDLVASLSLQDYADDGLPGAAPWMIKLGSGYRLRPLTELWIQLQAIGSRDRAEDDTRGDFEQTTQVDAMLRLQKLRGYDGLELRVGVINLFGETLKHPSTADTYAEDYPYSEAATLWLQLGYQP